MLDTVDKTKRSLLYIICNIMNLVTGVLNSCYQQWTCHRLCITFVLDALVLGHRRPLEMRHCARNKILRSVHEHWKSLKLNFLSWNCEFLKKRFDKNHRYGRNNWYINAKVWPDGKQWSAEFLRRPGVQNLHDMYSALFWCLFDVSRDF